MKTTRYRISVCAFLTMVLTGGTAQGQVSDLVLEKSGVVTKDNGHAFRDLNHNGRLDVYEDQRASVDDRTEDLLRQMRPEEKAGMLFINGAPVNEDGSLEKDPNAQGLTARLPPAIEQVDDFRMSHFNLWEIPPDPAILATWYNRLQQFAEQTRLGIPITIASDPRHHFSESIFSMEATGFTQFCETLGLAAIGDTLFTQAFADIVRREYLAVGIREALHPQIDLATEPRWARISGAFGEDADVTARQTRAYIRGMQGTDLSSGVACMVKHFPGGGPQNKGLDPHFEFQQGQVYPGDNFAYHLTPFEAAIAVGAAAIMPYYGVPVGQTDEDVAMSFNKAIITGLLRDKYGYDNVVCTDWGLITDVDMGIALWPARAWGVEHLSEVERVARILEAGVDQFGGETRPELVIQAMAQGLVTEERIDVSLRRLLRQKFALGLFDNPFVDETRVTHTLNAPDAIALGNESQRRSLTLLKNDDATLPLQKGKWKVYAENVDSAILAAYASVVSSPQEADFAIIRLATPWYPVDTKNPFALGFHHGDLDFKGDAKNKILNLLDQVPTIVDIYLDRPAVIPDISQHAKALIANYGASDASLCAVLFGDAQPEGNLPFELPSSMHAVERQLTDVPYDSKDPLFPFGFGLRYE